MKIERIVCTCLVGSMFFIAGCGDDNAVSGKVVQGPVDSAKVFADKIVTGTVGDYLMDSSEAVTEATTDSSGKFTLPAIPSYNYVIVSRGGTDTSAGKPAMQLLAPAGASNVSPLTTLVALNPTAKTKIESLGVKFDADISTGATSAALLLAKSVESTVRALTDSLTPAGGTALTAAQISEIQAIAVAAIAAEVSKSESNLTDSTALRGMFTTALIATIDDINASTTLSNISVSNAAAVAAAISDVVTTVAAQIGTISTTGTVVETTLFTPTSATTTAINNAITAIATSNEITTGVTVVPPAADTTAPTVTSVSPASAATGVALDSKIIATFSEPIDSTTFEITGLAGTVSYNALTKTVTFTPTSPLTANTKYTVTIATDVKDLAGNPLAAPKTWSFTTLAPTGATGGASTGTGINF